jgi:hypothetical protein
VPVHAATALGVGPALYTKTGSGGRKANSKPKSKPVKAPVTEAVQWKRPAGCEIWEALMHARRQMQQRKHSKNNRSKNSKIKTQQQVRV